MQHEHDTQLQLSSFTCMAVHRPIQHGKNQQRQQVEEITPPITTVASSRCTY